MTKLLALFAVVGLATTANAFQATEADATSSRDGLSQISEDSSAQVRDSKVRNTLVSSGTQISERMGDVLSSRQSPVQKGDDVSSTQGTSDLVGGTTQDGKSSVTGTYNMVVNVSGAVSNSRLVAKAKEGSLSVSQATVSVAKALYNSASITVQGSSRAVSSVSNGQNPFSVTTETSEDSSGELLSVQQKQKSNRLKYKFLAYNDATELAANAGIDEAIALGEFNEAALAIAPDFDINEAPLAVMLATAAARGEIEL